MKSRCQGSSKRHEIGQPGADRFRKRREFRGLGAAWIGSYPRHSMGLPYLPISLVGLGGSEDDLSLLKVKRSLPFFPFTNARHARIPDGWIFC